MRTTTRMQVIIALALVVALGLPALAHAERGQGGAALRSLGTTVAAQGQPVDNLRNRIANVLRARKARFDEAVRVLERKQARLETLASKVESLGADVSQVRALIDQSRQLLQQAREREQVCVQTLQGIADLPNRAERRAAFRQARSEGREAVALLKQSRIKLREGAHELRRIATTLVGNAEGESEAETD